MAVFGEPQYYNTGYTVSGSYGEPLTITYDMNTVCSSGTQPFVMVPAIYGSPAAEVEDDSPLAWLKEQIEEIAELARAA